MKTAKKKTALGIFDLFFDGHSYSLNPLRNYTECAVYTIDAVWDIYRFYAKMIDEMCAIFPDRRPVYYHAKNEKPRGGGFVGLPPL